jgi:hypothetical protein
LLAELKENNFGYMSVKEYGCTWLRIAASWKDESGRDTVFCISTGS